MKTPVRVLEVENVSKKFCRALKRSLMYGAVDLMKDFAGMQVDRLQLREKEFFALDDVNFSLDQGETLGIVGRNGSGKSTLLRLIAGIFPPDSGRITVRGRVGALIALGAGFHPHLTGRENIFLNGSIMGMSQPEIQRKLDAIIEFAELNEFIDAPVSTYSSGMTVRLGFAIASHSEPSLILVDEVLAVGDLAFALKCYRKVEEYRSNGGSTLLVSHSNQLIRNFCKKAIWLQQGKLVLSGGVHDVCDAYESAVLRQVKLDERGIRLDYDPKVRVLKVETLDENDQPTDEFSVAKPMKIRVYFECDRKVTTPLVCITIENHEAQLVSSNYSNLDGVNLEDFAPGRHAVTFTIDKLALKRGKYWGWVSISEKEINNCLSWHEKSYSFQVTRGPYSFGIHNPFPRWKAEKLESRELSL